MEVKKRRLDKGLDKTVVTYIRTPILCFSLEIKKIANTAVQIPATLSIYEPGFFQGRLDRCTVMCLSVFIVKKVK